MFKSDRFCKIAHICVCCLMQQSTEETLIKDRNRCIVLDTKGAFDWSYQISCNVIFCPLKCYRHQNIFFQAYF